MDCEGAEFLNAAVSGGFGVMEEGCGFVVNIAGFEFGADALELGHGVFQFVLITRGEAFADGFKVNRLDLVDLRLVALLPIDSGGFVDAELLGNALQADVLGAELDELVG